jgi:hypothetical protein
MVVGIAFEADKGRQAAAMQAPAVHGDPSGFAICPEQPPATRLQNPEVWHSSAAVHVTGELLTHTPAWQASCVHGLPSLQRLPSALFPSIGHEEEVPVQLSATSHCPFAGRQTVLADANPSSGQAVLVPVHASATSQRPAEARQTVPALPAGC